MFSFFKPLRRQPAAFISFDVEAIPRRAPREQLDTLIWGKTPQGEFGIRRLSAILREHKLKGNFLVDMAACTIYGDKSVQEVCQFLLGEGHEVHPHLHPELLASAWGWRSLGIGATGMDEFDLRLSSTMFKYTVEKFVGSTGKHPTLFRSGGYRFNRNTLLAAQQAGINAMSNYSAKYHGEIVEADEVAQRMEPFRWSNGIMEIPVDISSPEKSHWLTFLKNSDAAFSKERQTCNVVLHSWSLLRRNADGHHLEFGPELEEQFHRICAHLCSLGRVMGYDEYLQEYEPEAKVDPGKVFEVRPQEIRDARQCIGCGAILSPHVIVDDRCPSCTSTEFVECNHTLEEDSEVARERSRRENNRTRLEEAEQLYREEKFAEALFQAELLLQSELKSQALNLKGRVFMRSKRPVEAEAAFRTLMEEEGEDAKSLSRLSSALLSQKRFEEAVELALRAVECDPTKPSWRVRAAELLLRVKQFDRASEIVTTGLRHAPRDAALTEAKRRLEAARVSAQESV